MAHWAEIDENNVVLRVVVGNNNHADEGYDWLVSNLGGTWLKTSYNTRANQHLLGGVPFRKNFASPGFSYDSELDAFIPPQPFPSWILNTETGLWDSPKPMPLDDGKYRWEESILDWVEISD